MKSELLLGTKRAGQQNIRQSFEIRQTVFGVERVLRADILIPRNTPLANFKDLPINVMFLRVTNTGTANSRCLVRRGNEDITCLIPNANIPGAPNIAVTRSIRDFL